MTIYVDCDSKDTRAIRGHVGDWGAIDSGGTLACQVSQYSQIMTGQLGRRAGFVDQSTPSVHLLQRLTSSSMCYYYHAEWLMHVGRTG